MPTGERVEKASQSSDVNIREGEKSAGGEERAAHRCQAALCLGGRRRTDAYETRRRRVELAGRQGAAVTSSSPSLPRRLYSTLYSLPTPLSERLAMDTITDGGSDLA